MMLWLTLTLALASVAWFAAWARHPSKARWLAILAFLIASPTAGASLLYSMGWPVPIYPHIAAPSGELELLGVKLVPDVAIYVMLDVGEAPRLFILPWNAEQASKLQRMIEGAEGEGKIKMKGDRAPGDFYMDAPPMNVPDKPNPDGDTKVSAEREEDTKCGRWYHRRFAVPEHDGRGAIRVTYPDGRVETIPYMDASVQQLAWNQALAGAGVYLAMAPRKACDSG